MCFECSWNHEVIVAGSSVNLIETGMFSKALSFVLDVNSCCSEPVLNEETEGFIAWIWKCIGRTLVMLYLLLCLQHLLSCKRTWQSWRVTRTVRWPYRSGTTAPIACASCSLGQRTTLLSKTCRWAHQLNHYSFPPRSQTPVFEFWLLWPSVLGWKMSGPVNIQNKSGNAYIRN